MSRLVPFLYWPLLRSLPSSAAIVPKPMTLMQPSDEASFDEDSRNLQELEDGSVRVTECLDALLWLSSRSETLIRDYYTCTCTGANAPDDYRSYFRMDCSVENYCYVDAWNSPNNETQVERCVDNTIYFEFSTNETAVIQNIWKSGACANYYTTNSEEPPNRLCRDDPNPCALFLKDYFYFTTEGASESCETPTSCRELFESGLVNQFVPEEDSTTIGLETTIDDFEGTGSTGNIADTLCVASVELDGTQCNAFGGETCKDREGDFFSTTTPDCSNVLACATTFCQAKQISATVPERFLTYYPDCFVVAEVAEMPATVTTDPTAPSPTEPAVESVTPPSAPTNTGEEDGAETTMAPAASPSDTPTSAAMSIGGSFLLFASALLISAGSCNQ